jgi:hypothetical protein
MNTVPNKFVSTILRTELAGAITARFIDAIPAAFTNASTVTFRPLRIDRKSVV